MQRARATAYTIQARPLPSRLRTSDMHPSFRLAESDGNAPMLQSPPPQVAAHSRRRLDTKVARHCCLSPPPRFLWWWTTATPRGRRRPSLLAAVHDRIREQRSRVVPTASLVSDQRPAGPAWSRTFNNLLPHAKRVMQSACPAFGRTFDLGDGTSSAHHPR